MIEALAEDRPDELRESDEDAMGRGPPMARPYRRDAQTDARNGRKACRALTGACRAQASRGSDGR